MQDKLRQFRKLGLEAKYARKITGNAKSRQQKSLVQTNGH